MASGSHHEFPDLDENTQASLFYTSGTTGMPKGVTYTHRQLVLHTLGTAAGLADSPAPRGDEARHLAEECHVAAGGLAREEVLNRQVRSDPGGRGDPDTGVVAQ